jgi:hypothetical protein
MMSRSRGLSLLYVAPFLLGVLWLFLPVISGGETLFARDVLNTHLQMKSFQAEAMSSGSLPLVDVMRSGGQPHLGNPNTVPLYPDNLLYLFASPWWALNAHFWLHLLLAPLAFFAMARQWGLSRQASWAAGVVYATSGYYLSTMNLYNLTAGTTLAPLLVATFLALAAGKSGGRTLFGAALTWTLVLLGGDPMTAATALGAALLAVLIRGALDGRGIIRLGWAVALGTLVATPQLTEFLRILPGSYRGIQGYSASAATAASWSPVNLLEWMIPMVFGEPTMLYWGEGFYAGRLPLFYSLYPGLVALAMVVIGARAGGRGGRWTLALLAVGLFLVLGSYNPLNSWLLMLPGALVLRWPVKFWLLIAMALSLLAGFGFDRLLGGDRRRRLAWVLTGLTGLMLVSAVGLSLATSMASVVSGWMPARIPPEFADREIARWVTSSLISGSLCAVGALMCWLPAVSRTTLTAALVGLQVLGQVWLLQALVPTDEVEAYRQANPLLDQIPIDARVVHGESGGLFGPVAMALENYPDERLHWLQRDTFERLYPPAGTLAGRRYEFWLSPEGLDSFLTRATSQALPMLDDAGRLQLLEASGVTHLLLGRALEGIETERVRIVDEVDLRSGPLRLYQLLRSAPEVQVVGRVLPAADLRMAMARLVDPSFDPRSAVVLSSEGEPRFGGRGEVSIVSSENEALQVRVETEGDTMLVVQRSYLPIYSAEVDGVATEIQIANMHRMAIEVPSGIHEVVLKVDRGGLLPSFSVALLGLLLLALKARRSEPAAPMKHD